MANYKAHSMAPPTLTLHSHTFRIRISRETPGTEAPYWKAIGELHFTKHSEETWPAAEARFILQVQTWIDTYEQAQAIDAGVNAWLATQEWQTP